MHVTLYKNVEYNWWSICHMIMGFLKHGHLIRELNKTHVILINSKKRKSGEINDDRPISLCNVSYKFISILMVNGYSIVETNSASS